MLRRLAGGGSPAVCVDMPTALEYLRSGNLFKLGEALRFVKSTTMMSRTLLQEDLIIGIIDHGLSAESPAVRESSFTIMQALYALRTVHWSEVRSAILTEMGEKDGTDKALRACVGILAALNDEDLVLFACSKDGSAGLRSCATYGAAKVRAAVLPTISKLLLRVLFFLENVGIEGLLYMSISTESKTKVELTSDDPRRLREDFVDLAKEMMEKCFVAGALGRAFDSSQQQLEDSDLVFEAYCAGLVELVSGTLPADTTADLSKNAATSGVASIKHVLLQAVLPVLLGNLPMLVTKVQSTKSEARGGERKCARLVTHLFQLVLQSLPLDSSGSIAYATLAPPPTSVFELASTQREATNFVSLVSSWVREYLLQVVTTKTDVVEVMDAAADCVNILEFQGMLSLRSQAAPLLVAGLLMSMRQLVTRSAPKEAEIVAENEARIRRETGYLYLKSLRLVPPSLLAAEEHFSSAFDFFAAGMISDEAETSKLLADIFLVLVTAPSSVADAVLASSSVVNVLKREDANSSNKVGSSRSEGGGKRRQSTFFHRNSTASSSASLLANSSHTSSIVSEAHAVRFRSGFVMAACHSTRVMLSACFDAVKSACESGILLEEALQKLANVLVSAVHLLGKFDACLYWSKEQLGDTAHLAWIALAATAAEILMPPSSPDSSVSAASTAISFSSTMSLLPGDLLSVIDRIVDLQVRDKTPSFLASGGEANANFAFLLSKHIAPMCKLRLVEEGGVGSAGPLFEVAKRRCENALEIIRRDFFILSEGGGGEGAARAATMLSSTSSKAVAISNVFELAKNLFGYLGDSSLSYLCLALLEEASSALVHQTIISEQLELAHRRIAFLSADKANLTRQLALEASRTAWCTHESVDPFSLNYELAMWKSGTYLPPMQPESGVVTSSSSFAPIVTAAAAPPPPPPPAPSVFDFMDDIPAVASTSSTVPQEWSSTWLPSQDEATLASLSLQQSLHASNSASNNGGNSLVLASEEDALFYLKGSPDDLVFRQVSGSSDPLTILAAVQVEAREKKIQLHVRIINSSGFKIPLFLVRVVVASCKESRGPQLFSSFAPSSSPIDTTSLRQGLSEKEQWRAVSEARREMSANKHKSATVAAISKEVYATETFVALPMADASTSSPCVEYLPRSGTTDRIFCLGIQKFGSVEIIVRLQFQEQIEPTPIGLFAMNKGAGVGGEIKRDRDSGSHTRDRSSTREDGQQASAPPTTTSSHQRLPSDLGISTSTAEISSSALRLDAVNMLIPLAKNVAQPVFLHLWSHLPYGFGAIPIKSLVANCSTAGAAEAFCQKIKRASAREQGALSLGATAIVSTTEPDVSTLAEIASSLCMPCWTLQTLWGDEVCVRVSLLLDDNNFWVGTMDVKARSTHTTKVLQHEAGSLLLALSSGLLVLRT